MLHKNILKEESYSLLEDIQKISEFDQFYLAGGTALSLHLGHRLSIDLDFFSPHEFKTNILNRFPDKYKAISIHDNSIELISRNTKIFFFNFAYPLVHNIEIVDGINIANPIDIGLMKLLALQGRSTKKDIVDLYMIHKEVIELSKLLDLFENQYQDSFNSYESIKSIINIDDLVLQPDPDFLIDITFQECFDTVVKEIGKHVKELIRN